MKDSERVRRRSENPIDVNEMGKETKLPVLKEAFWASSSNKAKLQEALRCNILEEQNDRTELVASVMGMKEGMNHCAAVLNGCARVLPNLNVEIEEVDVRLIPHAVNSGAARVVLLSNGTDVVVLGLYDWQLLK